MKLSKDVAAMRLCFGVTGATDRGAALLICESFCHPCHFVMRTLREVGPRGSELQRFHGHASGLAAPKSCFKGSKPIGTKLAHFGAATGCARSSSDAGFAPVAVAESPAKYGFAVMTNRLRRAWDGTLARRSAMGRGWDPTRPAPAATVRPTLLCRSLVGRLLAR